MDITMKHFELIRLVNSIDCFVSLHKAEGWGLGIAEALSLGKKVIVTSYSGNLDFCTGLNVYSVNYSIEYLKK